MNEVCINTERLYIITPKLNILKRRLKEDNFYELVYINKKYEKILFPSDWPGNALIIYPTEIERREKNSNILPYWTYNIIDKNKKIVVGDICCKDEPNKKNEIEIGYGINHSQQKKGYASEAVLSLATFLFTNTKVVTIKAECNIDNIASRRVLEKCGFEKKGTRFDKEDGDLIIWEKRNNLKPM